MKFNFKYALAFLMLLSVEIIIAVFVHDDFIRPYLGDVLVVILIYAFLKSFLSEKIVLLPICIFVFALLTEIGQYFNIAEILNLQDNTIASTMIGGTFDFKDIICYFFGCVILLVFQCLVDGKKHNKDNV